jgi:hypothetical protein
MKVKDGRIEDIDNFTGAIEWCEYQEKMGKI